MTRPLAVLAGLAGLGLVACGGGGAGAGGAGAANSPAPTAAQPLTSTGAAADSTSTPAAKPAPTTVASPATPAAPADTTKAQPNNGRSQSASEVLVRVDVPSLIDGDISTAKVHTYLQRSHDDFKKCYAKQLAAKPSLAGRVTVEFKISPYGRPSSVKATGLDPLLHDCLVSAVRSTQFPKPYGGGYAAARVVMVFWSSASTSPRPAGGAAAGD